MIAIGFLNPALLWAMPLLAVPIVIHLLNRRRFEKRSWAAMEYLLAALKRNRKRIWLEQWLVLLLRTLAVALLIFLVARPQVAESLVGEQRMHHVILLDDSASMGQREGASSYWEKAKEQVAAIGTRIAETREGDLFTLLRSTRATTPDLTAVRAGPQLQTKLREVLSSAALADDMVELDVLVKEAHKRVTEAKEASKAELWLVTDFRVVDWFTNEQKPKPELAAALMQLDPQKEKVKLLPIGKRDVENLAIVDVRRAARLAVAGVAVEIQVELKNQGLESSPACELALEIDGGVRTTRNVEPLGPGDSRTIPFTHTFAQAGWHGAVATLPNDRLPCDDKRALALDVREHAKVLLVDGAPGDGGEDSETYYLSAALEPGGDARSGISATVIADHSLAEAELKDYEMIWLCNVAAPPLAVVQKLEQYVANGGGLAIFLGDQVDPGQYGALLWKNGEGLLPAPIGELAGDPDQPDKVFIADKTHPLLQFAPDAIEKLLARDALVHRHLALESEPRARVILRVRDATGAPLLVTRSYGRGGEVLLCGTSADIQWTNLPVTFAYVPIANEMHRFAARAQDDSKFNLGPRGTLTYELDAGTFKPDVMVRSLTEEGDEQTFTPAGGPATESGLQHKIAIPMAELSGLGLYEAKLALQAGAVERRLFARNVPVDEGRLLRATPDQVLKGYPSGIEERLQFLDAEAQQGLGQSPRSDVWRALALGLVLVLLLETLLAWRFGGRK